MRNIPASEYLQDLNSESVESIRRCDAAFGHHYDTRFHSLETTRGSVNCFQDTVVGLQRQMAELDKNLTYICKVCCETLDHFLTESHRKLESLLQRAMAMSETTEFDPALNFLKTIKHECELDRMHVELKSLGHDTSNLLECARTIGFHLDKNSDKFPRPAPDMFNIVTCRNCGTKLRLPEQSGDLIALCPKCRYRFAYSAKSLSFGQRPRKRPWQWILSRIRGKADW